MIRLKRFLGILILIAGFSFACLQASPATAGAVTPTATTATGEAGGDQPPYSLTDDEMAWGTAQLEQMLKNRPEMARYVRKGDDLWNWTVRQFAGEYVRGGIQWDPGNPGGPFDSVSCRPDPFKGKKAYIQVTRNFALQNFHTGEAKKGPTLWFEAGSEFCNLMNSYLFQTIDDKADTGGLSQEDFAFEMMAVENIVTEANIYDFFYKLWMPNCQNLSLPFEDKEFLERSGGALAKGWTPDDFVKYFKLLDDGQGAQGLTSHQQLALRDMKAHYDLYTDIYGKNKKPHLMAGGAPVAPTMDWPAREKWLAELSAPKPASVKLDTAGNALLVDDFESGQPFNHFGGAWLAMMDHHNLGTRINPQTFQPANGGCPSSPKFAAHIWGHLGKNAAPWPFAQLWTFPSPDGTSVDLSGFSAFRFYTKGDKKKYWLDIYRASVTDYAYFQSPFQPDSGWTQVTLPFDSFKQPDWGTKVPLGWNDVKILIFAVDPLTTGDKDFDFWVDGLELVK